MENSTDTFNIGDFNEGGAEPDRLYSMQASNSQFDLRSLGVDIWDEPVNCSHKMARQVMTSETNDQSSFGLFEEECPAVNLSNKKKQIKPNSFFAAMQDFHQNPMRAYYSAALQLFQDMHQISKQQIERIENLDRQNTTSRGAPVPFGISLPNPASIPKACPEAFTDPQEQKNEPNNQEPVPGVNTSMKRGYGKGKGTQPVESEELSVDSFSGPTVPLLIGIPSTNVLSVGRGSRAEEALQKGRVQRKCDQCCCYIM